MCGTKFGTYIGDTKGPGGLELEEELAEDPLFIFLNNSKTVAYFYNKYNLKLVYIQSSTSLLSCIFGEFVVQDLDILK